MNTATTDPSLHTRLAQRLTHMIEEADRLLHTAALKGDHEYDVARDRLVDQMEQARRELAQFNGTLSYKARGAARRGDRAVREHPYTAIGVAAGIGMLLGWLSRRR
jgi:ElaB/YqjD/DUF883 family membrane-anchored ribosome-binding protein